MPAPPRLLFYVQHLLGIGHARRAASIAGALAEAGFAVTVASGGMPVPGLDHGRARVVGLPPVRAADGDFKRLVDADGREIDVGWKKRRAAALLACFAEIRPDVLLIESYPFGRRQFRFELAPLLGVADVARPRPVIAASVRDILVTKNRPDRAAETVDLIHRYFDRVLVHGDPDLVPFERTFPATAAIADKIRYTGYVVRPPSAGREAGAEPGRRTDGTGEVLVSVGGGAVGLPLLRAALAARQSTPLAAAPWRLLAGPDVPEPAFRDLVAAAPPGVTVERARSDFPAMLTRCRLSISQAGYNTTLDILQAGCPAVFVPYAAGEETEQTTRARILADLGLAAIVPEADLTPDRLAHAVAAAITAPPRGMPGLRIDGAAQTARHLLDALAGRDRPA